MKEAKDYVCMPVQQMSLCCYEDVPWFHWNRSIMTNFGALQTSPNQSKPPIVTEMNKSNIIITFWNQTYTIYSFNSLACGLTDLLEANAGVFEDFWKKRKYLISHPNHSFYPDPSLWYVQGREDAKIISESIMRSDLSLFRHSYS